MRHPDNLAVLERRDELAPWLERLQRGKLAVDTETTGLTWDRDRVGGISFAAGRTAIYACRNALGGAVEWLHDQVRAQRPLVFHSAKSDLHWLRGTFGLRVPYPVDDTLVQSFLVDNRGAYPDDRNPKRKGRHELKALAWYYVDPDARRHEERLHDAIKAAGGRGMGDVLMAPRSIVGRYAAYDAWYTLQLDLTMTERIRNWIQPGPYPTLRSLYETERWLVLALRDMEERGIMTDQDFLERWRDKLARRLKRTKRELIEIAGRDINWNSAPQLRELLYEKLRIPIGRLTDGGKSGVRMPSTDEVTLKKMSHPIGAALLRFRDDGKQHGTYALGLLAAIKADGAIHPRFKQTGAETGRMSCEDPNLQQQTRESGVRAAFHARKGRVLRFADYSQVEMRFGAHFANEPTLIQGFLDDPDFDTHRATAIKMYGVKEPTKQQRKFGKIMNFTLIFGGGEDKVTEQLIAMLSVKEAAAGCGDFHYKPAKSESPHRALAQLLRQRYFDELPAMRRAVREESQLAEERGYVMNAHGRHRFLVDEKWYKAFNTKVQGTAGDEAKRGLVAMYRNLELGEGTIALLLQVHDEAIYESDGDPKTDRRVLELLKDETSYKVPIIADVSGSKTTWQAKEKIKL